MAAEQMKAEIGDLLQGGYGFDVYIAMKNDTQLIKKFILDEGDPAGHNGFKQRIRNSIVDTIRSKFLSEESQYVMADALANEQNRLYVIDQSREYEPFSYLTTPDEDILNFSLSDKDNADAILFKFTKHVDGRIITLWAYQKIQPSAIPNKKKAHFQLRVKSSERPDIFEEMTDQLFLITQGVDLLVLGTRIITDNIKLMERHFGLEEFVRASAFRAVRTIETVQLVSNVDKLQEYVQRPNKRYAKKMMTIHKYPVAVMSKSDLLTRVRDVERWQNVFELRDGGIYLRNFTDVEQLIDLFTERYTRSEVTGQEYDTEVKEKALPIR